MTAEAAYLFRHAITHDAAYQLQLPADRGALHGYAFEALEELFGRPPVPPPLGGERPVPTTHNGASASAEVVRHLRLVPASAGYEELLPLYVRYAAEYADATYEHHTARALWLEYVSLGSSERRHYALRRAGQAALYAGETIEALRLYENAVATARAAGDASGESACRAGLGNALTMTGRNAEAEAAISGALELARACGDRHCEVLALIALASLQIMSKRSHQAESACRAAIAAAVEIGDRSNEGYARINLASALVNLNQIEDATQEVEQGLAIARETQDARLETGAIVNRAMILAYQPDQAEAISMYRQGIALTRKLGDRNTEAVIVTNLASALRQTGDIEGAGCCYTQALQLARETGNRTLELHLCMCLGNLGIISGQPVEVLRHLEDALPMAREARDTEYEGRALCWRASALVRLGQADQARAEWRTGMALLAGDEIIINEVVGFMQDACAEAGIPPLDAPDTSA